ncbi:MAG: site-2 protease family protein, partial [Parachlamydia sp.]|nr:site-2 protease family protein [Parachlamydia sp.]
MLLNLTYILLAILGLSFLIFIHELGHYWMARRTGMRVEVFSIGFGRPLYSWLRDGVRWQIGWLLFGGYVKIAGQELQEGQNQADIPDGFYAKSPFDRIKVAFMGPFVNLLFALAVFGVLWFTGGRVKNYSEFTHKIGWIDPHSELYAAGIRPGDEISAYDGRYYQSANDNLYAPMIGKESLGIQGYSVNYATGEKDSFNIHVKTYPHPASLEKGLKTAGILASANYIIYDRLPGSVDNPLPEGSPLQGSGIEYGDRVVWADGERIFSSTQLDHILNDNRVLLTIQRDDQLYLKRVPRVLVQELKLDPEFKEELTDWQFEANLKGTKIQKLYAIPYNLTHEAVVENPLKFIDKEFQTQIFPEVSSSDLEK